MKNGKVKKIIWGETVRTNGVKWGSSLVTKRTFGLGFGLFLAHLTFIYETV
jgi:hypothetical protein